MNHPVTAIWSVCALLLIGVFVARTASRTRSQAAAATLSADYCTDRLLDDAPVERRLLCGFGVRLNHGDAAELRFLPGIGPEKARAIIEYRDAHGPFRELSDLTAVKGIGLRTVDAVSPWLAPLE
jgi:competence ComEA-like helix-hairpin-helix protein